MIQIRNSLRLMASIATLGLATAAHANPLSLDGQTVTVTVHETGNGTPEFPGFLGSDTVTVISGPEIVGGTVGSNVGQFMLPQEYIDLGGLQVVYHVGGSGAPYTGTATGCTASTYGCSFWDAIESDGSFLFSGLNFGMPGAALTGVALTSSDVFGAFISDLTASSFRLNVGTAGILYTSVPQNGVAPLGTLTMALQVATPVPLPDSLPLLLAGLGGLAFFIRRRATSHAAS